MEDGGGGCGGGREQCWECFFSFSGCPNLPSSGSTDSDHEQEAGAGTPLKCRAARCVNWRRRRTGVVGWHMAPATLVARHELGAAAAAKVNLAHQTISFSAQRGRIHTMAESFQMIMPPSVAYHHLDFLYICVFIPVLPLGSSEPIFFFF